MSSLAAGVYLLLLLVLLNPWAKQIPMPALVAVMIMVSNRTFSWSLRVGVGVLLSALFFARKVEQVIRVRSEVDPATDTRTYTVLGKIFFASAPEFLAAFDLKEAVAKARIDVSHAHFWDLT